MRMHSEKIRIRSICLSSDMLFSAAMWIRTAVDAGDLSQVENFASNSLLGYEASDVTGDDNVDARDLSIVENNAAYKVSPVAPGWFASLAKRGIGFGISEFRFMILDLNHNS